ncbi:MAG: hypothetical protein EOM91_24025 [Sphingobacteriia bacterium]|nr:hypothetical protein [Sphingobacteriia bacterium]
MMNELTTPSNQTQNLTIKKNKISSKEETDLDYARNTYIDLIEKNRESIDIMLELARASEHPRVFEVLSNSIKTTSEITEKLIGLHVSNKQLRSSEQKSEAGGSGHNTTTTNNNVFIGSTEELQKLLQGKSTLNEKVIP